MAATSTPAHTYTVHLLPKRDEMYRKAYHLRWEGKENVLFSQEPGHAEQRQRWPLRWPDKQLLWWGALDWTRSNVCTFISCHGALTGPSRGATEWTGSSSLSLSYSHEFIHPLSSTYETYGKLSSGTPPVTQTHAHWRYFLSQTAVRPLLCPPLSIWPLFWV